MVGRQYRGRSSPCRRLIRPRAPDAQLAKKHRLDAKCAARPGRGASAPVERIERRGSLNPSLGFHHAQLREGRRRACGLLIWRSPEIHLGCGSGLEARHPYGASAGILGWQHGAANCLPCHPGSAKTGASLDREARRGVFFVGGIRVGHYLNAQVFAMTLLGAQSRNFPTRA